MTRSNVVQFKIKMHLMSYLISDIGIDEDEDDTFTNKTRNEVLFKK